MPGCQRALFKITFLLMAGVLSYLYLPHIFFNVSDFPLIIAAETDPGSIVDSIEKLFQTPYYSMFNGYHSKFYGWSYYALNFFVLIPVKTFSYLASYFFEFNVNTPTYISIRAVHFLLGFGIIFIYLKLFFKFSKNYLSIFFGISCLSLILFLRVDSLAAWNLYWFIHPEPLGILASGFVYYFAIRLHETRHIKYFYYALTFSAVAVMAKQTFLVICYPVILMLFLDLIKEKKFRWVFIRALFFKSSFLSIFLVFIIHPYLFSKIFTVLKSFSAYHDALVAPYSFATSASGEIIQITYLDGLRFWLVNSISALRMHVGWYPFLLSLFILPINFLVAPFKKLHSPIIGIFSLLTSAIIILFFLFIALGNRNHFSVHYLFPVMPLLLLNLYLFFLVVVDGKSRSFRLCVFIPLILLNAFAFYYNFNQVQEASQKRLSKDNLSFISYNFLLDQFVDTDRIAHDHFVAVPSKFNNCSYWQSCSTYQGLVDFNPTVVAFWPEYNPGTPIGGYANTNNLVRYVKEKKMRLVVKLTSNHPDTLGHIIHVYAD